MRPLLHNKLTAAPLKTKHKSLQKVLLGAYKARKAMLLSEHSDSETVTLGNNIFIFSIIEEVVRQDGRFKPNHTDSYSTQKGSKLML